MAPPPGLEMGDILRASEGLKSGYTEDKSVTGLKIIRVDQNNLDKITIHDKVLMIFNWPFLDYKPPYPVFKTLINL